MFSFFVKQVLSKILTPNPKQKKNKKKGSSQKSYSFLESYSFENEYDLWENLLYAQSSSYLKSQLPSLKSPKINDIQTKNLSIDA